MNNKGKRTHKGQLRNHAMSTIAVIIRRIIQINDLFIIFYILIKLEIDEALF